MASITWFLFSSRLRILLTALALFVGLYALAGFVIVPWLARPRIVDTIRELTGREARLDTLKLNPFTLSGTMGGFEVTDLDGEKLLSFDRAYANVQSLPSLFKGEIHLKEIDVANPFFRFQINEDGSINIADLINQVTAMMAEDADGEPEDSRPLNVDLLRVTEGSISFTDHSRSAPFVSVIAPISFDITSFHTGGESDAPYAFSATSESGESFSWEGFAALNPVRSKGTFKVEGFSMPKYEPFYDIVLNTDVTSGTIAVSASYEFLSGDGGVIQLYDASVRIEDLEMVDGNDQGIVTSVASVSITGAAVDYLTRSLEVESIELKDGLIHIKRLEDGQIRLVTLLDYSKFAAEPTEGIPTSDQDAEDSLTPSYLIKSFSLEGYTIEVEDLAAPTPVSFALDNIALNADDISSEEGASLSFRFGADSRTGGHIEADGSMAHQPVAGSLNLAVQNLALKSGDAYLSEFADVHLADGRVTVSGKINIDLSNEKPTGDFSGSVNLLEIQVIGDERGEDLAKVTRVGLEDIKAVLDPMSIEVGAIYLVDPSANLTVSEDGSINLLRALRMEAGEEPSGEAEGDEPSETTEDDSVAPAPTGLTLPFPITIGQINLENMSAMMTDRSVAPSVSVGLETLSGTISGLSSEELARADVDLLGTLTGGTELTIVGKINPLIEDRYSDVAMTFSNFNLTTVSPYSAKYAGYELSKGKLSFDLTYSISQAELEGENKITIDQLTLGEKVESEDALNLPIPLAVSLLKDPDGVITLDVPVSGNLNDPEFGIGKVLWGAVGNVIAKLVTSPFKMLGGLIPGGADIDISFVGFDPGVTILDEEDMEKLVLLEKAMAERPTLTLEIHPGAGGPAESNLLRTLKLDDNLRVIRWRELKDLGKLSVPLEEVELTPADRDRLIIRSFQLMFPNQAATTKGIPPSSREQPQSDTPTTVETTALATGSSKIEPKQESSGGIGGFFKRLFKGGSKETAKPKETAEAPLPAEIGDTDVEQPIQSTETPTLTMAQMESRLLETVEIPRVILEVLAGTRAEAVRSYLETTAGIAPDRMFVVPPENESAIDAAAGQSRVTFSLE
ncbi:MAG: hypothetical protein DRP71_09960 [Verrucomicrobia bacterium]|nr:MAG: hypothetical protein DRP71_09960 [Verrucomicrobiota bacterium]